MPQFCHLHNHTEYSLLDGAGKIERLVEKAARYQMPAIAISDHGNMYGVPKFVLEAKKAGVRPIIGSEFYLAGKSRFEKKGKENESGLLENRTYHQILFAKNAEGYRNLMKLSSLGFSEGYHYKPRIDKEILEKYSKGLVATTCCLASEINQAILKQNEAEAEALLRYYLSIFGNDYYIEIQRHGLKEQDQCNEILLKWAKKYNLRVIATNDVHYIDREDSEAHDLLLALQTGSEYDDPNRFRFLGDNQQLCSEFYLKTPDEMAALFHDIPEALDNTLEVADKCTFEPNLNSDLLMPVYQVPPEYRSMDDYLTFLAFEGAKKKYKEISPDIEERIRHELKIIAQMGFAGYFLIVQEFTNVARERGVLVGPGRGSAAGSVVAYCIGIIDIDPIRYSLLFERFLNPERVSPPDIDMDFDDEGRQEVINFVIEKYGQQCVSQIITYGTMGAKTALRDVGRVLKVPLTEVNRIAKFIPEKPGITFKKCLLADENPDGYQGLLDAFNSPDPIIKKMLKYAQTLEGTARHTGIHAAGVIIAPGEITDYCPTAINNTRDRIVTTQFEGPLAEKAGLLKMDFLGLKTLSILKTAAKLVEENKGIKIDLDNIDLEDLKTYQLYQNGETIATFQFESDGMQKYLRQLKPTNIEDLIAMNALYRPGPMDNIPAFVRRKHGQEPINYPDPMLEPILSNTYGIMVYQEQIMEVAKTMGGYTLGGADLLRRAMGKKKKDVMEKERAKFVEGAERQGVSKKVAEDVFDTMEKFAEYGFNKSHSAAYSVLAFRTAYMKANFPAEYMAAVLSHNLDNIDKITFFIEECRRMNIPVRQPCVNESDFLFSVNKIGEIRFGMGAIKGLGENSARAIIEERKLNGGYRSIFELCERIPGRVITKKTLECLIYAGALDVFSEVDRPQYFKVVGNDGQSTVIDLAIQYGNKKQQEKNSSQVSLFGTGNTANTALSEPTIPYAEPWPLITRLNYEREVIGFYLSGHPLDRYKMAIQRYTNTTIQSLPDLKEKDRNKKGIEVCVAGIITSAVERMTKKGTKFGNFVLEDFSGSIEISLFGDDYPKFKGFLSIENCVFIRGLYQPGFREPDAYELKPLSVEQLDTLMEKRVKKIYLDLPIHRINEKFMDALENTLLQFKGNCPVICKIYEPQLPSALPMQINSVFVKPEQELFEAFQKLDLAATFA